MNEALISPRKLLRLGLDASDADDDLIEGLSLFVKTALAYEQSEHFQAERVYVNLDDGLAALRVHLLQLTQVTVETDGSTAVV